MAYAGGYAGGYADTLVPPTPTGPALQGYYPPRPNLQQSGSTRSRYRLLIIGSGFVTHTEQSVVAMGTRAAELAHGYTTLLATGRIEATTEQDHTSRQIYRARPVGKGNIPDPDEWIVFL